MARAAKAPPASAARQSRASAAAALVMLEKHGSKRVREEMGPRYGIVAKKAYGAPMAKILLVAKTLGRDHALALELWRSGWYEARLLAALVDEPERVTAAQMDRWAKDFDNWGVVDTVCFKLFDQSPHAFSRIDKWARSSDEFVKRGAFALLACVALHRKDEEAEILSRLALIAKGAHDERNFVKKGVSWALRAIGASKNPKLRTAARRLANQLAASDNATARWVGKDAAREFARKP